MKTQIIFPDSFIKKPHSIHPSAYQWKFEDAERNIEISIVGGAKGLYGDGITTFEMWDYKDESPIGWMDKEEINEHLSKYN